MNEDRRVEPLKDSTTYGRFFGKTDKAYDAGGDPRYRTPATPPAFPYFPPPPPPPPLSLSFPFLPFFSFFPLSNAV